MGVEPEGWARSSFGQAEQMAGKGKGATKNRPNFNAVAAAAKVTGDWDKLKSLAAASFWVAQPTAACSDRSRVAVTVSAIVTVSAVFLSAVVIWSETQSPDSNGREGFRHAAGCT